MTTNGILRYKGSGEMSEFGRAAEGTAKTASLRHPRGKGFSLGAPWASDRASRGVWPQGLLRARAPLTMKRHRQQHRQRRCCHARVGGALEGVEPGRRRARRHSRWTTGLVQRWTVQFTGIRQPAHARIHLGPGHGVVTHGTLRWGYYSSRLLTKNERALNAEGNGQTIGSGGPNPRWRRRRRRRAD